MTDSRITPANDRVAASHLRGKVDAASYVDGDLRQMIGNPFLCSAPGGPRDRQMLFGDVFRVLETRDGWMFGMSEKDGHCGYLPDADHIAPVQPTHAVSVRTTWVYPVAGVRQPALMDLHLNSRVRLLNAGDDWSEIKFPGQDAAFVPTRHLRPVSQPATDPVAVARQFLGTPYVWAGNSGFGIDCSGLVQAAWLACGVSCPSDSDLQAKGFGRAVGLDDPRQPGDLLFWPGHVAMVADAGNLIHSSGYHMCVSVEPTAEALARIERQGNGPVAVVRRHEPKLA